MTKDLFFPLLVADIGGTNARFGTANGTKDSVGRLIIEQQLVYSCKEYSSFEGVFDDYLQTLNFKPSFACIAIAGPVFTDYIQMTNLPWGFSVRALIKQFGMTDIQIINDFGALAYATLNLQAHEVDVLYAGNSQTKNQNSASRVIIGAGTGLGVAGLVKTPNHWQPVCGEGGHVSFAALNNLETELRKALLYLTPNQQHLSIEHLVSGPGLVNIYNALCHIKGIQAKALTPSDISTKAIAQSDDDCVKALQLFCKVLGSIAGDVALTMGAFGGVYLSGGILPKIATFLTQELFIDRYLDKGIQRELLETIPVYLITSEMPALNGAAHWMLDINNSRVS